jgi:hypothetical protein
MQKLKLTALLIFSVSSTFAGSYAWDKYHSDLLIYYGSCCGIHGKYVFCCQNHSNGYIFFEHGFYNHCNNLNKIERLEKRKKESYSAKYEIPQVKILNARFYKQYTPDSLPISTAELTIKNNSTYSITKVFFKGKLTTHITGKVLIDDSFSYELPSPLDHGEQNTYDIHLNSFGRWAKVNAPDLAIFDVTIEGVETKDGDFFVISFPSKNQ